jgi:25S rRNA (adenine2142-N1)-methyltransferase
VDDEGNPIPIDPSAEAPADLSPANAAPVVDEGSRAEKVALIQEYHAIQKQLASPALTDALERKKLLARQKELGGLEAYQAASVHGGDKKRGGESGKWCVKQLQELKVGVDKGKAKEKVEPIINADGSKTWPPKKPREKVSWSEEL